MMKHKRNANYLLQSTNNKRTVIQQTNMLHLISVVSALLLLAFPLQTNSFFIDEKQSPNTKHWSYYDQSNWSGQYSLCGRQSQSPIDIAHKNVIFNNNIKLQFYNYDKNALFKIQNAHHTIRLNYVQHDQLKLDGMIIGETSEEDLELAGMTEPSRHTFTTQQSKDKLQTNASSNKTKNNHSRLNSGRLDNAKFNAADDDDYKESSKHPNSHSNNKRKQVYHKDSYKNNNLPYNGIPSIKLDWLDDGNNEFTLRDIHFHWAERKDNGSEHAIEGRRAAMEMHLVHIKKDLDRSAISYTSDSVAVIAIMIESYKKSNADFNPIMDALKRINASETSYDIEYQSLFHLLPNNLDEFYTYSGSLTTPPCLEVVNWIVMRDRLLLNAKHIEMFRNLYSPKDKNEIKETPRIGNVETSSSNYHLLMPNIRNLNPLNNRVILSSFSVGNDNEFNMNYKSNQSGANSINHCMLYQSYMLIFFVIVVNLSVTTNFLFQVK